MDGFGGTGLNQTELLKTKSNEFGKMFRLVCWTRWEGVKNIPNYRNKNSINSEKTIGQFKRQNAKRSHNKSLNHDPPRLQTALVCGRLVLYARFRGLQRKTAVVVGHISSTVMANNLKTINRKKAKAIGQENELLYGSTFGDKQELVGLGRHDSIHHKSNASNSEQTNRIKYENQLENKTARGSFSGTSKAE
jgi:hypothetical protein